MQIYIDNGNIRLNDDPWTTVRILNDELTQVYELTLDVNDQFTLVEVDEPEVNHPYTDVTLNVHYFLAIKDRDDSDLVYEPVLYLDGFDCEDMCEMLHENSDLLKAINMLVENLALDTGTEGQLEVTENGWKLI